FSSMRETLRLKGSTEAVQADLRLAKSESIKRSGNVSVTFRASGTSWCYGFSQDTACNCNTPASCVLDGVEYRWDNTAYPGIALESNVSGNRFSFQYRRGTVTAGNVHLTAPNGKALRVVVSGLGRIRMCSPRGESKVSGYPDCS
ncbi:GspH/FimT family protein, partial [Aquabacterium sp. A08]|uniref:GspH/FimT family protein n=1 Tax=Aquabacterium sp. A08 TaxID=2718532 RepID=UPI0014236658